ncbi:hypothetical protein HDK90DRAFT_229663 [Phyllosticta capitalensis]|uniref:Uncharacterized protein n=1 Tax=Phyllosticta capitalensis TaxID=121624 RepID=A0ABR1YUH9_9PEZI
MAISAPAKSLYFSATGGSPPRHQLRRPSFKKTHVSSGPGVSAPRTHCPKDVDAFSYNPTHLQQWMMPQDLWEQLPHQLKTPLASVQHAGAAVLTGLDRIEEIRTTLLDKLSELDERSQAPSIEQIAQVINEAEDHAERKRAARARHDSVASTLSTPGLSPDRQRHTDTDASSSPSDSGINTPLTLPTQMHPIAIPFATKLPESALPAATGRLRTSSLLGTSFVDDTPCSPIASPQSFPTPSSPPLGLHPSYPVAPPCHPHEKYYAAELLELRSVSLVRLRHSSRRVDVEWSECKQRCSSDQTSPAVVERFEAWWEACKRDIIALEAAVLQAEKAGPHGLGVVPV